MDRLRWEVDEAKASNKSYSSVEFLCKKLSQEWRTELRTLSRELLHFCSSGPPAPARKMSTFSTWASSSPFPGPGSCNEKLHRLAFALRREQLSLLKHTPQKDNNDWVQNAHHEEQWRISMMHHNKTDQFAGKHAAQATAGCYQACSRAHLSRRIELDNNGGENHQSVHMRKSDKCGNQYCQ